MPENTNNKTDYIEQVSYQLDNLTLSALTCGNPNDKPVLCLHGYLDNAASFLPMMQEAELLADRYIIALEFAGHGHSSHRSNNANYHFFDYVSDLVALFSANGWQQIDIIGHSMGAMVASAFAAAFPEYVKSLTMIDCFGFISTPIEQTTEQLRKGLLSRTQTSKELKSFTQEAAIKARMYVSDLNVTCAEIIIRRSLIAKEEQSSVRGESPVQIMLKNNIDTKSKHLNEHVQYRWRSDRRLRAISPYRLSLKQGQQLYKDIKCPIQLIYGDKGMKMVLTGLNDFSKYLNHLVINKIQGGHHVHMEQPKALLTLVKKFYTDIDLNINSKI